MNVYSKQKSEILHLFHTSSTLSSGVDRLWRGWNIVFSKQQKASLVMKILMSMKRSFTDPFCTHSSPGLHGPQSGFSPTQILRYKTAAHWWYSSSMGLQIAKWELIVGSKTQQASLQSESFSQNVPEIRDKKRAKIVCAIDLSWTCNSDRARYKMYYTHRNKLNVKTIHTWISFGLFLASSKRADQTFAALFVTIASHVQFVTFFTIKNIAVHSFFTRLLLWTLCFIITWGNHLQANKKLNFPG